VIIMPLDPERIVPLVDMLSATYRRFLSLGHTEAEAVTLTRAVFEVVALHLSVQQQQPPPRRGRDEPRDAPASSP
jgi:hypothetical protein